MAASLVVLEYDDDYRLHDPSRVAAQAAYQRFVLQIWHSQSPNENQAALSVGSLHFPLKTGDVLDSNIICVTAIGKVAWLTTYEKKISHLDWLTLQVKQNEVFQLKNW